MIFYKVPTTKNETPTKLPANNIIKAVDHQENPRKGSFLRRLRHIKIKKGSIVRKKGTLLWGKVSHIEYKFENTFLTKKGDIAFITVNWMDFSTETLALEDLKCT